MKKTVVISIAHSKGGVGKSTISWNLINFLSKKGFDVGALDLDYNQVLNTVNLIRENSGITGFDLESPQFSSDIDNFLSKKFDYIVADLGGYDTDLTRYMLKKSDFIITPLQESFPDVVGFQTFAATVSEIGAKQFHVLLNNVNPQKKHFDDVRDIIFDTEGAVLLESMIHSGKTFDFTMRRGKSVFDIGSKKSQACRDDISALAVELLEV